MRKFIALGTVLASLLAVGPALATSGNVARARALDKVTFTSRHLVGPSTKIVGSVGHCARYSRSEVHCVVVLSYPDSHRYRNVVKINGCSAEYLFAWKRVV